MLTKTTELIVDIRIGGCLGCTDCAFTLLRDIGQAKSKLRKPNFREANFQLLRELANKTPWETVFTGKGAEQSWQIFKEAFLRAQELSHPQAQEVGKGGHKTSMAEPGPVGQTEDQEKNAQAVEPGTDTVGRVLGNC